MTAEARLTTSARIMLAGALDGAGFYRTDYHPDFSAPIAELVRAGLVREEEGGYFRFTLGARERYAREKKAADEDIARRQLLRAKRAEEARLRRRRR